MKHITFLGLGAMGARMAAALLDAGFSLTVWNRDASKADALVAHGATLAPTPREAAANADMVFAMVRDDEASRTVWLDEASGALAGMRAGSIAIECSTLTPAWVRTLGEHAVRHNVALLDAPVSGSRPQAEAKQLIFMVGGEAAALARAEPALKAMGAAVHHAGAIGAGATVKLFVNAMIGVQFAALAELIGAMKQTDVDAKVALDIFGATHVASPVAKNAGAAMLAQSYAPLFSIELVEKDFGYIERLRAPAEHMLPLVHATRMAQQRAMHAGLGEMNLTALVKLYA
jgi:3-hydroxyisobutyrate dehydrogenase